MFELLAALWAFVTVYYVPVLAVYLAGGVTYAVFKWVFKAYKLRTLVTGLTDNRDSGTVEVQRNRITANLYGYGNAYPPQVKHNKGRLFGWAVFWPINLVWTMFHDVAKEAFTWVYNKLGGVLQRMSDKILPK